jgi:hypothetical protein
VAEVETQPEAVATEVAPIAVEEVQAGDKTAAAKKDAKKSAEEPEDDEHAKDGVSLDELFSMKPEIFQTPAGEEDEASSWFWMKNAVKWSVARSTNVVMMSSAKIGSIVRLSMRVGNQHAST